MRRAEWYLDEDVLGLGSLLARARLPVTWPGDDGDREHPRLVQAASPVAKRGLADEVWIPVVAASGLAILTRDRRIMERTVRVNAVLASRARVFTITSPRQLDLWGEARVVAMQWEEIEMRRREPGPFIDAVTASGVRRLIG